jgi:hypothetical protein
MPLVRVLKRRIVNLSGLWFGSQAYSTAFNGFMKVRFIYISIVDLKIAWKA